MVESMAIKKQEKKLSYKELSNCLRMLSIDAVEQAKSGHPGAPMGMADIATVLWKDFLNVNPKNPNWLNRDRFVLSNGHASALLYALLHMSGFDLSIDELKSFRQLGSKTPGHPESDVTPGVEVTTGPLGQGFANSVGIALAQKNLSAKYNKQDFSLFDYHTYVFMGDGCLMEGISHEAASLAGSLKLNNLIAFWDNNHISIDGKTDSWFSEDVVKRFVSYGWHVIENIDGHDHTAIFDAIKNAQNISDKPCLIVCNTKIGYGSSKEGTAAVHGAPLGDDEIKALREKFNWNYKPFEVPAEYYAEFDKTDLGVQIETEWNSLFAKYEAKYPELAQEILRRSHHDLPSNFENLFNAKIKEKYEEIKSIATRKASNDFLNNFMNIFPEVIGGSADLSESNGTLFKDAKIVNANADLDGNYIHYGVREFAMAAIANGFAATDLYIPYVATFLTFIDYARNAIRMSALMHRNVIYVLTHDSIGLGEDGPTHQPIEHLTMLRATPNLNTWRPADITETYVAWQSALGEKSTPSALILTRQNLDTLEIKNKDFYSHINNIKKGAYIVDEFNIKQDKPIDLVLLATGSEVKLALDAANEILNTHSNKNYSIRVVSMPCSEKFDTQDESYKNSVLPENTKNIMTIEAGATLGWYKYIKNKGIALGIDSYGKSARASDLFKFFGFTKENVCKKAIELLNSK